MAKVAETKAKSGRIAFGRGRWPQQTARALGVGLLAVTLAGCGSGSKWYNPMSWFGGSDKPAAPDPNAAPPPDINSVPNRASTRSSPEQRQQVAQGLVADRDNARYTDDELRGKPSDAPPTVRAARPAAPAATALAAATPAAPAKPESETQIASDTDMPGMVNPGILTGAQSNQIVSPPPSAGGVPAPVAVAPPAPVVAAPPPRPAPPPIDAPPIAVTQSTFQQALAASAGTVTTLPASAAYPTASTGGTPASPAAQKMSPDLASLYLPVVAYPQFAPGQSAPLVPVQQGFAGPGRVTNVARITFAGGSAQLDPGADTALGQAAAEYRKAGGMIRVMGWAPSDGTNGMSAYDLALARARAVGQALERSGISPAAVLIEAHAGPAANGPTEIFLEN